jgi:hypothetical protein
MWPGDIYAVANMLNSLSTTWFPANTRPYIYQEVKLMACFNSLTL